MLLFDSHVHVGNFNAILNDETKSLLGYKEYSKNTAENCVKKAIANSVSKMVIFPFPLMEHSFEQQNDYVLKCVLKYPHIFIPFVLPAQRGYLDEHCNSFWGIKDHFYFDFHSQVNRDEILQFAEDNNKVYLFHAHWKHWGERITHICKSYPRLRVIVAHSARIAPFESNQLSSRILELQHWIPLKLRENFYFETSTIRNSESIELLVQAFGAEHVLWGSDFPYYSQHNENIFQSEMSIINDSNLNESEKERIFSKNFRTLFQRNIWVRQAVPSDKDAILNIINSISAEEKKYLALSLKLSLIRQLVKTGKHILIAEDENGVIMGFLRSSDRHNKTVMIEEVYVSPEYRKKKIATLLIQSILSMYEHAEVKTFASNTKMNKLLDNFHFTPHYSPKGTMISWKM